MPSRSHIVLCGVFGRTLEVCQMAADDPLLVAARMSRDDTGDKTLFPVGGERVLALAERARGDQDGGARARQVASLRRRSRCSSRG